MQKRSIPNLFSQLYRSSYLSKKTGHPYGVYLLFARLMLQTGRTYGAKNCEPELRSSKIFKFSVLIFSYIRVSGIQ